MSQVKITKQFSAVPEGAVYGRLYAEGEIVSGVVAEYALRNNWGVLASDEDLVAEDAATTVDAQDDRRVDETVAQVRKARVLKQCEFDVEGKPARFAKGVTVEGELAERMVAAELAAWVEEKPAPAANKNAGPAPSNKAS